MSQRGAGWEGGRKRMLLEKVDWGMLAAAAVLGRRIQWLVGETIPDKQSMRNYQL